MNNDKAAAPTERPEISPGLPSVANTGVTKENIVNRINTDKIFFIKLPPNKI
jgi:hypothetical protein